MIRKIESEKFRKHPSGVKSIIGFFRIALLLAIGSIAISLVVGLVAMFKENISINVISNVKDVNMANQSSTYLSHVKTMGTLNFEPRNFLEWLLLPRYSGFDIYINSLSLVITWQLYRILKEINLDNPFLDEILKRIKIIYLVIFYGIVLSILKYFYFMLVIKDITDQNYMLTGIDYISYSGYFSIGAWVIVYLFAHVYKKGVMLQNEQDLTI